MVVAVFLVRHRKHILATLRSLVVDRFPNWKTRRRVSWFFDLFENFYLFIVFAGILKLGIYLALKAKLDTAALLEPYLEIIVTFFLGLGVLRAVAPIITQRKYQTHGQSKDELIAVETTFKLIPFVALVFWAVYSLTEVLLFQALSISVLGLCAKTILWFLLPVTLYVAIWKNRLQWRETCRSVSSKSWWQNTVGYSKGKFWEPFVLLLGGGLGVYLIAW